MPAHLSTNEDGSITVTMTFMPGGSMLESEMRLQKAINEAGSLATGECLRRFDTDGGKIEVGGQKLTSCGQRPKNYQTPYGVARIERHVYQSSKGGRTYCPLDFNARIVRTATPLFTKQTAFKYATNEAAVVVRDFAQHGRTVSRSYVAEVAGDVASVVEEKEDWNYAIPSAPVGDRVKTVAVGLDGACVHILDDGWKQLMVGTITLYDGDDERIDTIYVANAPEAGKAAFYKKMDKELAQVREAYPEARYTGVADGAHDLWTWLEPRTTWQIVDFWHATEYVAAVAPYMCRLESARPGWLEEACHRLKHDAEGAATLLSDFRKEREGCRDGTSASEALDKAISYFENHLDRMSYSLHRAMGLPIGSGVTEAACKTVAKQRLCGSGMRWTLRGVAEVLSLRTLVCSGERWEEFWKKATQFGFTKIAHSKRKRTS